MPPFYAHDPFLQIHGALKASWLDGPMVLLSDACLGLPAALIGLLLFAWVELRGVERGDRSAWASGARRVAEAMAPVILGFIASGIAVYFLKDLFDWPRPLSVYPDRVKVLGNLLYVKGFPSGHASTVAVLATVATCIYGRRLALVWVLPALGGLSRVYVGAHWVTDVIGGWVLGVMLGIGAYLIVLWIAPKGYLSRSREARRRNTLDMRPKPP